jgi:hypothetical protein
MSAKPSIHFLGAWSKIVRKSVSTEVADAHFIENFIFPNSFAYIDLQLDFSRKSKYFLKLSRSM